MDSLSLDKQIKLPEFSDNLKDEIVAIGQEYIRGALDQEFAMLRICRLVIEDCYRGIEVYDEFIDEKRMFTCQEDLVKYICNLFNISRQTVFTRLDGYKKLINGLDRDYHRAFRLMLTAPGTPKRFNSAATFDSSGKMVSINLDKVKALPSSDPEYVAKLENPDISDADKIPLVKEAMGNLADAASELKSRSEATKMVDNVLAKNMINFSHNGCGNVVAHCVERSIDSDGVVYDSPEFTVEWMPDCEQVPGWVLDKFYRRLNAIEEK